MCVCVRVCIICKLRHPPSSLVAVRLRQPLGMTRAGLGWAACVATCKFTVWVATVCAVKGLWAAPPLALAEPLRETATTVNL